MIASHNNREKKQMLPLDVDKFWVRPVQLVKAIGGVKSAIHIKDDDDIERLVVPPRVVEVFQKSMKSKSSFIHAIPCSLIMYEDHILGLEHKTSFAECKTAVFNLQLRIRGRMSENTSWYFDGNLAYELDNDQLAQVQNADELTSDGVWRQLKLNCLKVRDLPGTVGTEERSCAVFTTACGKFAISAPVWKSMPELDTLHETCHVNLTFALSCANVLSKMYGDEVVESLNLPDLMTQLQTVNLPNLPVSVKSTVSCGLDVKQALAWLMGFQARATTLDEIVALRRQMKYLTTKGVFKKDTFNMDKVYKAGHDPLKNLIVPLDELRNPMKGIA